MKGHSLIRRFRHFSVCALAVLLCGLAALPAHSHHSVFVNFDTASMLEIQGVVSSVDLRNPHSRFTLQVREDDGSMQEWLVEWSDRNSLVRRKVSLDKIREGDEVSIVVWPSRQLEHVGYFVQARLADGSIFRDCGFREFREAVVNSTEFSCPEAEGRP